MDNTGNILSELSVKFKFLEGHASVKRVRRMFVDIPPENTGSFNEILEYLRDTQNFTYLCTITGLDSCGLRFDYRGDPPRCLAAGADRGIGRIEQAGYTTYDDLVHGYGGGYLPPVLGSMSRPATSCAEAMPNVPLRETCRVIQPNVTTRDHKAGVQFGELVRVTATGFESRLHRMPHGLFRAGQQIWPKSCNRNNTPAYACFNRDSPVSRRRWRPADMKWDSTCGKLHHAGTARSSFAS